MIPILTLTLNPAIDLAADVPQVLPGIKLRCTEPRVDPGGGGLNVSRAIRILGGQSTAFVALGGNVGGRLAALIAAAGIEIVAFAGPGETRESLTVTETGTGQQFRFMLPGARWSPARVEAALARIDRAVPKGGMVVLSGSLPPGVPADFPALVSNLLGQRARLLVDTSGAPLAHLAAGGVPDLDILRMDDGEAASLAGRPLDSVAETADFASALVARGVAGCVIIARGADGSVLADARGRWHSRSEPVEVVSAVGAGDTFVGAFVLALARGAPPETALAHGVAAAAAAVITEATELCHPEDVERLLPSCAPHPV
ncbi:1-phosphofructokinase family hexose kinase [Cereibacter azotoformans]|uniref:Phosphofructokinase n=2 Tax=Cereibacter TaxID=1653176 RepID=A0A2T5KDE2_9RHOB|nr:1-phosphofructokinase family hexose kinase [Cereibacter azotoformans]AXQ93618.1 1-phosphofructokinase family hexose kinase [Cereibacter sphaeroides]MBO4168613.1 1-phosphofructokinase family hexose kinase [Cereibacter azotoformans]PTR20397.1 6-phosphofructokinase [Cereibacter azotoformans]UIJ31955.1 1-phosphofructokinase family hexose kinase [Cereibacter azotoformans]